MAKKRVSINPPASFAVEVEFNWYLTDEQYAQLASDIYNQFEASRLLPPQVTGVKGPTKEKKKPSTKYVVFVTDPTTSPQDAETAVTWAVKNMFPDKV